MAAFRRRWPGLSYGRGEDWHYVGEVGEPAFDADWDNNGVTSRLGFRIREAGVVDIQGVVTNQSSPTEPTGTKIFTLPVGYRPSGNTYHGLVGILTDDPTDGLLAAPLLVESTGDVGIGDCNFDPIFSNIAAGAYSGTILHVYIAGSFFLNPAN